MTNPTCFGAYSITKDECNYCTHVAACREAKNRQLRYTSVRDSLYSPTFMSSPTTSQISELEIRDHNPRYTEEEAKNVPIMKQVFRNVWVGAATTSVKEIGSLFLNLLKKVKKY